MDIPPLDSLKITGDISIEPVTGQIPKHPYPMLYLIMGSTGAGKSSFIEAFAGESQQLSISKNQLAGYTQTVDTYQVLNLYHLGYPVYLVDTPGFSDSKISEIEIMDMIRKWMDENDMPYFHRILIFMPITATRLPGSRRRTMNMLERFLAPSGDFGAVTFVTTMWDTLHNEWIRKRAESNFDQLRDEVCKNLFGKDDVSITKFMNTKSSALEVMDVPRLFGVDSFSMPVSSASPNLYQDLHERIEGALQEKQIIDSDLTQPDTQTNADLRAILEKNQRENNETLTKFIGQLIDFGTPPPGFHRAAQHLRKVISARIVPEDPQCMVLFQQWAQEPEILEEPVPDEHPESESSSEISHSSSDIIQPRPSKRLALKGLLRRLLDTAKRCGSKWFQRRT